MKLFAPRAALALAVASLACSLSLPPAAAPGGNGGNSAPGAAGSTGGGGVGGGAAGTGGRAGTSGTAGAGGAAGTSGTAGTGGAAGTSGTAGTGGAGNQIWRAPATVEVGKSPRIAMGGSTAALVWLFLDGVWNVKGRLFKDENGSWGAPTGLQREFAGTLTEASAPKVAMNARGVALVTWKQGGNADLDGGLAFRLPVPPSQGDGWTAGARVTSSGGRLDPVVALGTNDAQDRGIWMYGTFTTLFFINFIGNGPSGAGASVNIPPGYLACPSVSSNARADSMAVWLEQQTTGPWRVMAWFSNPTLSQVPPPVALGSADAELIGCPRVAIDDLGRAIATWTVIVGGTSRIATRSYDPSSTWGAGATMIDTGTLGAFNPELALSTTGEGFIAWEQGTSAGATATRDVRAVHLQLGRGLDAAGALAVGATAPAALPRIVVTRAGTGLAVWTQAGRIWANTFSAAAWGQASPIDVVRSQYTSQNPDLATDGNGRAIAAWESSMGGVPDVVVARFE